MPKPIKINQKISCWLIVTDSSKENWPKVLNDKTIAINTNSDPNWVQVRKYIEAIIERLLGLNLYTK